MSWFEFNIGCFHVFLPALDAECISSTERNLQFKVHCEPNHELKFTNGDSIHVEACFKVIS